MVTMSIVMIIVMIVITLKQVTILKLKLKLLLLLLLLIIIMIIMTIRSSARVCRSRHNILAWLRRPCFSAKFGAPSGARGMTFEKCCVWAKEKNSHFMTDATLLRLNQTTLTVNPRSVQAFYCNGGSFMGEKTLELSNNQFLFTNEGRYVFVQHSKVSAKSRSTPDTSSEGGGLRGVVSYGCYLACGKPGNKCLIVLCHTGV